MTLFLLLSCGSGSSKVEDPKTLFLTSIANLGKGFLDVFTSFSDMVAGAFGIKAETKKSDIGKYFTDIENTMNTVKAKLNDVVATNGNYPKIKEVVNKFIAGILDKISDGAKIAASGAGDNSTIGDATVDKDAVHADAASVNALVKGIKTIVDVVLKGKGDASANATKDEGEDKKYIGKLFSEVKANAAEAKEATAASASIGAVSGADILQAIVKSGNVDNSKNIEDATDAASIAAAKKDNGKKEIKNDAKKDAVIAGGIALRAMAKGGQFAIKSGENDAVPIVNRAAASAVSKTLGTLMLAIRNTVDTGLKSISEALAAVKQEDMPVETSESGTGK
ncbi:variable large family protein (plasmid) [Borrelia turicatae 91E135]|nr:variable large family protein [Borrelia turicatae 91E135]